MTQGMKTSEFWMLPLTFLLIVAGATTAFDIPENVLTMWFVTVFGYGGGRTLLKREIIKKDRTYA